MNAKSWQALFAGLGGTGSALGGLLGDSFGQAVVRDCPSSIMDAMQTNSFCGTDPAIFAAVGAFPGAAIFLWGVFKFIMNKN